MKNFTNKTIGRFEATPSEIESMIPSFAEFCTEKVMADFPVDDYTYIRLYHFLEFCFRNGMKYALHNYPNEYHYSQSKRTPKRSDFSEMGRFGFVKRNIKNN